jgi:8-amino-7-oxononanoate synthase
MTLLGALERGLAERRAAGRWRTRRELSSPQGAHALVDGRAVIAFASNDYLGLANDPALIAAAQEGAAAWGTGAGASHLVCGHQSPHAALETTLAAYVAPCAGARALLLSNGYLANLAIVTALVGRGDAVFGDRLNHACLNDAALLARADLVRYPHLDADSLARRLASSTAPRRLIATDAVFSMDGDIAPLAELRGIAEQHDAWLVVDDAHGFGVQGRGRGSVAAAGLASERIIVMGTLGKAAGVAGAFVVAHPAVIETIVQTARPYIYTTAAPAMLACALQASLAAIRDGRERRARLARSIDRFRAGAQGLPWTLLPSTTPIQPLLVGDDSGAVHLAQALLERGVFVPAIRPPTVPEGTARLRISLSAAHSDDDIDRLVAALRDVAAGVGVRS